MSRSEYNDRKTKKKAWNMVIISFMILFFIFATCISCMGIYVKPVSEDLGIQRTAFSLVITVQALAMMLSALWAGKILEQYSIRVLMAGATAVCGGCLLMFSWASEITLFYFGGVLIGCAISLSCNTPIAMLLKNWFPENKQGLALGIAFVGSGAGAMVLNPLYSSLILNFGWRMSFRVAGILVILLVPFIMYIVKRTPGGYDEDKGEEIKVSSQRGENVTGLRHVLSRPVSYFVLFGYVIMSLSGMAVLNHGVPYMTDNGITAGRAAWVISFASAVLIAGKVIMGWLYGKLGCGKATVVGVAVLAACIPAFWFGAGHGAISVLLIFIVLYGFGMPVGTISQPLVISRLYGDCDFGPIMGLFTMMSGIGGMLQVFFSIINDVRGSYDMAWLILSGLCLLNVVIFAIALRPKSVSLSSRKGREETQHIIKEQVAAK